MTSLRPAALIAVFSAALFFIGIGQRPIARSSEGRVARVAQEMLDSGDWVVPHLNGAVRLEKPPLSSWLVAGVTKISGAPRVQPWHAHLVSGLCAIVLVLLVYFWLASADVSALSTRHSPLAASLAALILAAAPGFLLQARSAELDMLLALWVALAFWGFWNHRTGGCKAALLIAYAALALSILTKGHVALVVVAPTILIWSLYERSRQALPLPAQKSALWHIAGVALLCAIVLPWAIPFIQRSGIRWEDFSKEGLRRFGKETGHQEIWCWYLYQVPGWFLPWFLLLPPALAQTWTLPSDGRSPLRRLCWIWLGWSVLLFSCLSAKQRHYAIPFFPPLAILIADAVARWLEHFEPDRRRAALRSLAALSGLLALTALTALAAPVLALQKKLLNPSDAQAVWISALSAAAMFIIGAARTWPRAHNELQPRPQRLALWWAGCIGLVVVFTLTHDRRDLSESPEAFCRQVCAKVPPQAALYDYNVAFANNTYRAQVLFYLDRKVSHSPLNMTELLAQSPEGTYVMTTAKNLKDIARDRYEVLAQQSDFLGHEKTDVFLIKSRGASAKVE